MLKAQSTISKVTTMADNTIRLQVDCQEMNAENELEIFQLRNKLGWFVFNETGIQESDIPTDPVEVDQKTPSQRLRGVLYVLWRSLLDIPEEPLTSFTTGIWKSSSSIISRR